MQVPDLKSGNSYLKSNYKHVFREREKEEGGGERCLCVFWRHKNSRHVSSSFIVLKEVHRIYFGLFLKICCPFKEGESNEKVTFGQNEGTERQRTIATREQGLFHSNSASCSQNKKTVAGTTSYLKNNLINKKALKYGLQTKNSKISITNVHFSYSRVEQAFEQGECDLML